MRTLTLVALLWTGTAQADWRVYESKSAMTDETYQYAVSPYSDATRMSFPYAETKSQILVSCGVIESSGKVYYSVRVRFTKAPNVPDAETKSGYNVVRVYTRWDSGDVDWSPEYKQDWGDDTFTPYNFHDEAFVEQLKAANKLRLQFSWHGQGDPVFTYSMAGSSRAISAITARCEAKAGPAKIAYEAARAERLATERAAQVEREAAERVVRLEREAAAANAAPRASFSGNTLRLTGTDWRTTSFKRLYEVYADGVLVASVKSATPPTFELDAANAERLSTVTVITVDTSSMMSDGRKASTTSQVVQLKQEAL